MKQVININFQGRVVPIEVTAFEILKKYTESLNRYFELEEGKDEIINDIESRIGELFQERLKAGSTCITDEDINAIIRSMGRPEDFETDQATAEAANNRREEFTGDTASIPFQTRSKRLFRDENDKAIAGVCSGLANYFGIDVVIVRIIFVVLLLASFGLWFVTYIILWIAVPSSASTEIGSMRKKLYRDSDNKLIAGVSSGIGNYFGINPWIPRVLFLLPFVSFIGYRWHDFDFVRVGFSPGSLIIYIILWLVIPEAHTTAEKLEMKGEKVDMNSIKNSVMEEMKGVQQRAEKFGKEASSIAQEKSKAFTAEVGSVAKRGSRSIGDIIAFLFKIILYFILGCIGFAIVIGLFAMAIFAIGIFPMKDFVLTDGFQNAMAWGTLIFFIAVPIIGIITWIIRRLARIRSTNKTMRFSFFGLWFIGLICFIALIVSVGRDFRSGNNITEQEIVLTNPGVSSLEITATVPNQKYIRNRRWFKMEPFQGLYEDTALIQNVSVHLVKSNTDSFRVTMVKLVNGRNRRYADTLAALMNFNAAQKDSALIIDRGIAITRKDKFRNQRIVLTVYVPVGKQIRVDRSVGWGQNITLGPWEDHDWDMDYEGDEHGWDHDKTYIMRADGLYTLDGQPADEWKHPNSRREINGIDVEEGDFKMRIDRNGIDIRDGRNNYRYDDSPNAPTQKIDSMKMELDREAQRVKDSLQKVKENIDKQLEKLRVQNNVENSSASYTLPAYNPMLIMH